MWLPGGTRVASIAQEALFRTRQATTAGDTAATAGRGAA